MAIGDYEHLVAFENPGAAVPDGDGGYTQAWTPTDPATWYVAITPAAASDIERLAAGSVITMVSSVVKGDWHPNVSTATRMIHDGRTFAIVGTRNVEERSVDMELLVVEQVGNVPPLIPYADQVKAAGAIHHWRLGESGGLITVDAIGEAHATISGGVTLNQPGAIADGNPAMVFDGVTGRVVTSAITLPSISTVEAWIQTVSAPFRYYFQMSGLSIGVGQNNGEKPFLYDGSVKYGTSDVNGGQWHLLAWVFDGTTARIYVDGVIDGTGAQVFSTPITGPVSISAPDGLWPGSLDEIAIYPHALTPAQITAHYTAAAVARTRGGH